MHTVFSTADTPAPDRSRHWHDVISSTYFPLLLHFRQPETFGGELRLWQFGEVSLSRLTSGALSYKRLPEHLKAEPDEQYLITVPARSSIEFVQGSTGIRCRPGGFILERGHEPYEFSHAEANDLWVVKVKGAALKGRVRAPDRFCALQLDATSGAGGLFVDTLHLLPGRYGQLDAATRSSVGEHLIELLALALKSDDRVLRSVNSSVREAHLARIEDHVRRHLSDPNLEPRQVADACGISVRYLHALFRDTNQTLGAWIREQRLSAARQSLGDPRNNQTIGEIAYRFGFGDQAQFSRLFRTAFGATPSEYRQHPS